MHKLPEELSMSPEAKRYLEHEMKELFNLIQSQGIPWDISLVGQIHTEFRAHAIKLYPNIG